MAIVLKKKQLTVVLTDMVCYWKHTKNIHQFHGERKIGEGFLLLCSA